MTVAPADASASPGALLDGRYRLDRRWEREPGASVWRGTDELLRRPVAVQVFDRDTVQMSEVFAAVRLACRLTHGGLAQVFDANQDAHEPYLVREWLGGRDLGSMLAAGPLDPHFAVEAFRRASEAVAVAHDAGVYHLRLTPRSIVWGTSGRVKIVGVGIEAAVAHARADDPRRSDTRALARLLRLALAGRWREGRVAIRPTPRRAMRSWLARHRGVGRELETIADLALNDRPQVRTADRLATELARLGLERRAIGTDGGDCLGQPGTPGCGERASQLAVATQPMPAVRARSDRRGVAA
jgi:serine/threonine protein kinase